MSNFPSSSRPCITFLTDFGIRDTFVGQMKGVVMAVNVETVLVDLTHEISPQQILQGAYAWADAVDLFPRDTIHVGVVDPGVGSTRRLVAAEIGSWKFVCPDNGLLSVILKKHPLHRAVSLDRRAWWRSSVSNTFHGRDIIAPVAAAWSLGHDLSEFGSLIDTPLVTLLPSHLALGRTSVVGEVIDIDRYGNVITNIEASRLPETDRSFQIEMGAFRVTGISACYADVEVGDAVAVIGSHGRVEIAIRNGNAAEELQVTRGRRVAIRWTEMTSKK